MKAHTAAYGAETAASWGALAAGWPVEVTGAWLAAESGRVTKKQYVTYVSGRQGWLAAATWMRLNGSEQRTGYTSGELSSADPDRRWLPCASVVMPGATQPAVVWDTALSSPELGETLSTLAAGLLTAAGEGDLASVAVANVPCGGLWRTWREVLGRHDFLPYGQPAGTLLAVPPGGIPEYLQALPRDRRKKCRREMRSFADAGVSVSEHGPERLLDGDLVTALHQRYAKYGHSTSLGAVRDRMERAQGLPGVRVLVARERDNGKTIAFKAFVVDRAQRRIVSRFGGCLPNDVFAYFNVTFYEPIRYAAEHGLTSMTLGTGTYPPKLARGATLEPLDCFVRALA